MFLQNLRAMECYIYLDANKSILCVQYVCLCFKDSLSYNGLIFFVIEPSLRLP